MSILIKDIDIPKCCNECKLKYAIKCETYIGYHHKDTSRARKCPIVEVQTPHGRLIDADKVKERMIPLNFSVQKWISEVDLDVYVPTIIEADKEV